MKEILSNPLKMWMLIGLAAVEIPAFLFLVIAWFRDCKKAKRKEKE